MQNTKNFGFDFQKNQKISQIDHQKLDKELEHFFGMQSFRTSSRFAITMEE